MEINYKKLYLDHHDCTLESDYTSGYDYEMSEEYTADSYSVYLCIYAGETVDLSENIYYYTGDLDELLKEKIEDIRVKIIQESKQDLSDQKVIRFLTLIDLCNEIKESAK